MPANLQHRVAMLFREFVLDGKPLPESIELVPAGPDVNGLDGRKWRMEKPELIVERFTAEKLQRPIDWEHATQLKAQKGERAPAAGWIKKLEARNGALWGDVTWTPDGADDIQKGRYKYLSPTFLFDNQRNIIAFVGAGLTNDPNLIMPALNHEGAQEHDMLPKKVLDLLGLKADASEEAAIAALETKMGELQTAKNRQESPSLDKFVPRGDYELAVNRATKAEGELATNRKAALEKEIEIALEAASTAGKITPATREYHLAQCRNEGGLERFKEFMKTAPVVGADSGLDKKTPPAATPGKLSESQLAICRRLNITPEEYAKAQQP